MNIKPLGNRILVPDIDKSDNSLDPNPGFVQRGGILISDKEDAKTYGFIKTKALKVGPGCTEVKEGDTIVYHEANVNEVNFPGGKASIVLENFVGLVILPDEVETPHPAVD